MDSSNHQTPTTTQTTHNWRQKLYRFLNTDLPATVQAEKKYVFWAHLLFFIPAISMIIWISHNPHNFGYFANEAASRTKFIRLYGLIVEAGPAEYASMLIIHLNHILVMMIQFLLGGFLFGLGTIANLINQGLHFGSLLGLSLDLPLPWLFLYHTFYRGALDLLSLMLAAASGLRIGTTLLSTLLRKTDFRPGLQNAFYLFLGSVLFFLLTLPAGMLFYPLLSAHILIKTIFNLLFWVSCYTYLFWPRAPLSKIDSATENHS